MNKKYLKNSFNKGNFAPVAVLVVLLVVVISGVLVWQFWLKREIEISPSISPTPPADEITDWKSYKNQEYGLEFEYPREWGTILFEYSESVGVFVFTSPEEKIKMICYHQPSDTIAFIEYGRKFYLSSVGEERYQQILKVIDQDKTRKLIYTGDAPEPGEDWGVQWRGNISEIDFSPDGKYIILRDSGYDDSNLKIVEIQSHQMILDDYNVWCHGLVRDNIHWSSDSKILAIESEIDWMGGRGSPEALFVSDYGHPEILNKIFDVGWQKAFDGYEVDDIYFVNNISLSFSVVQRDESSGTEKIILVEARYEYNTQTKELKEL